MTITEEDYCFLRGVLLGLQHIAMHDQETIYHECVRDAGPTADLVAVAKREDAIEWSGLRRYGYCDSLGRLRSRRGS